MKRSRLSSVVSLVLAGIILALAVWIVLNKQLVSDSFNSYVYQPSGAISDIENRVGFTKKGERIFRATQPVLSDADDFNNQCPRAEVKSPIIGCYTNMDRVYIYNVINPDLDGIEEVTAAHEMLHAAWMRLGQSERGRLGGMLEAAYDKINDEKLEERMDYYRRNSPTELHNELHSILGTEQANIGSDLERHYGQYFKDRKVVLGHYDRYNKTYESLYEESNNLWDELKALSDDISAAQEAYVSRSVALTSEINSFNSRADSGGFSSVAAFNSERAQLVRRTSQLETERIKINSDIVRYNTLHESYKKVALQIEVLNKSIDSFESLGELPTL